MFSLYFSCPESVQAVLATLHPTNAKAMTVLSSTNEFWLKQKHSKFRLLSIYSVHCCQISKQYVKSISAVHTLNIYLLHCYKIYKQSLKSALQFKPFNIHLVHCCKISKQSLKSALHFKRLNIYFVHCCQIHKRLRKNPVFTSFPEEN